jgi:hypothetical protein
MRLISTRTGRAKTTEIMRISSHSWPGEQGVEHPHAFVCAARRGTDMSEEKFVTDNEMTWEQSYSIIAVSFRDESH